MWVSGTGREGSGRMLKVLNAALLVGLLTACAGPPAPGVPSGSGQRAAAGPKVAAIGLDEDLRSLWGVITDGGGGGEGIKVMPIVHQALVANTADGSPQPRLLRELPSMDAGTWKVFADGTMET